MSQQELLVKWLVTLPWRQRDVRECRISGPVPNLFRGKIPPFSEIDKPEWVRDEERKNPEAEFWQFQFSVDETKTGIAVEALLPRQLIGLLEKHLKEFRAQLFRGVEPETLFLNSRGKAMSRNQMTQLVSRLALRHGGRRVALPSGPTEGVPYTNQAIGNSNTNATRAQRGPHLQLNDAAGRHLHTYRWLDTRGLIARSITALQWSANTKPQPATELIISRSSGQLFAYPHISSFTRSRKSGTTRSVNHGLSRSHRWFRGLGCGAGNNRGQ